MTIDVTIPVVAWIFMLVAGATDNNISYWTSLGIWVCIWCACQIYAKALDKVGRA